MPRLFPAFLVALLFAVPSHAGDMRVHASTTVALSNVAVCTPVGLTDATRIDSGSQKVRAEEYLTSLETNLDTIVTAVTLTVQVYRDAACEVKITDEVDEADLDADADATGGAATKIAVEYTESDDSVPGLLYIRASLDAGTANAEFRVYGRSL